MILIEEAPPVFHRENCIVTGTFDGLHIAHKQVVLQAQALAKKEGMATLIYTFDGPPANFFGAVEKQLFTRAEKIAAFKEMGVEYLHIKPFHGNIANMEAETFCDHLLNDLQAGRVVSGYNFHFGAGARGNPSFLKAYMERVGIPVRVVEPILEVKAPISSTRIRKAITQGDVETANQLLGYSYGIQGRVIYGRQLGRALGFPTANVVPPAEKVLPPNGVYVCNTIVDGKGCPSIANIGLRPTVAEDDEVMIETHLLDRTCNLYGKEIRVEFLKQLRGEQIFDSVDALQHQVLQDKETARQYFK